MKITLTDTGKTVIELSEANIGTLMKTAHPSQFTTRQLLETMVQIWNANFEQDAADALDELEEIQHA